MWCWSCGRPPQPAVCIKNQDWGKVVGSQGGQWICGHQRPGSTSSLLLGHGRAVFVALSIASSNISWVQALDASTGSTMWQSDVLQGVQLERLELYGSGRLLATSADSQAVFALNAQQESCCGSKRAATAPGHLQ